MIYFDNIHPDFEPVPVDPGSVTGIRMRKNGTTLIWQLGRMDVKRQPTSSTAATRSARPASKKTKKKSSTRGKRILDFTRDRL